MATVLKCKICGGDLEVINKDIAICQFCGSKQLLPKMTSERKANLYDRANHYRSINEFDKATAVYEQVLAEDDSDAEVYWDLVLCRFGIEYVEDPRTKKRIPTVNRTQFQSIFDDRNYHLAIEHASDEQREIIKADAEVIDRIQKGILEISSHEQPYDIFICYKETDDFGKRTQDSVIAQDMYNELSKVGYKVFFSRVSLEDKLGSAYEPYIFAALNSAKVMIVVGTKPEYFNSVWVKNEWSRYLGLISVGEKKTLIPAYNGLDPYDLPEEFSHLQAQDLGKLGYMQDLIRGIEKIIGLGGSTPAANNIDALLKRGHFALEDQEWNKAKDFFDEVLNIDPENGKAYVGILLAENGVESVEKLSSCGKDFYNSKAFLKATRFAPFEEGQLLNQLALETKELKEAERKEQKKKQEARSKKRKKTMLIVMVVLVTIAVILGASYYLVNYKESQYRKACNMMDVADYENAISVFKDISSYKDSEMKILECEKMQIVRPIMNAQIGDVVQFGNYNGITDWVVMDILENEYIILVGAEKIAEKPFSDTNDTTSWQLSTIRQWLNDDYYNEAFSEKEKSVMISAHVGIKGNIEWVKDEDNTTGDWVILPEYKMCPLINELGLNEKYDSMWISENGSWAQDSHDCVYFGNDSYSYAKTQVTSERRVFPEICIDIN